MVKPLNSKPNILERRRQERIRMITHGKVRIMPANKGAYLGSCNRSACLKPKANWYNWSTQKYYCEECAGWLNCDKFNHRDAMDMYGHDLCTEGTREEYLKQTVKDIVPVFEKQVQAHWDDYIAIKNADKKTLELSRWVSRVCSWKIVGEIEDNVIGTTPDTYMYSDLLADDPRVQDLYQQYVEKMKSLQGHDDEQVSHASQA